MVDLETFAFRASSSWVKNALVLSSRRLGIQRLIALLLLAQKLRLEACEAQEQGRSKNRHRPQEDGGRGLTN